MKMYKFAEEPYNDAVVVIRHITDICRHDHDDDTCDEDENDCEIDYEVYTTNSQDLYLKCKKADYLRLFEAMINAPD